MLGIRERTVYGEPWMTIGKTLNKKNFDKMFKKTSSVDDVLLCRNVQASECYQEFMIQ